MHNILASYHALVRTLLAVFLAVISSSCVLLLLNGHLSHGYYESPSYSFKCKLPGGALSTQLEIKDRENTTGETVTFSHNLGFLWRVDHLRIGKHKIAQIDKTAETKNQLEQAKNNYFQFLINKLKKSEIQWEEFKFIDEKEILTLNVFLGWNDVEEFRDLVFSIDDEYLNVIHYSENFSDQLQNFTTGAVAFYKGCDFNLNKDNYGKKDVSNGNS